MGCRPFYDIKHVIVPDLKKRGYFRFILAGRVFRLLKIMYFNAELNLGGRFEKHFSIILKILVFKQLWDKIKLRYLLGICF